MTDLIAWVDRLLLFYEQSPEQYREDLFPSIVFAHERLRAVVLEADIGENRGDRTAAWRAKVLFITGRALDPDIRCVATTKEGIRCRNRPLISCERCHVHATNSERKRFERSNFRWEWHYQQLCARAGVQDQINKLHDIVAHHHKEQK